MEKIILVVDDEVAIREIIRDFFEMEKFKVIEARNGKEALEIIKRQSLDCVLSDVCMPGGNGIELAHALFNLKENKPPILFMTGFGDISESAARSVGVFKVIQKPFLPDELVEAVKMAIARNEKIISPHMAK